MSMPSEDRMFPGRLSDGRSADSTRVEVRLGESGLEVLPPGERRRLLVWPYGELHSGVPLRSRSADVLVSLEPGGAQTLYVADPGFARALLARAPALSAGRRRLAALRPGLAVVAIVAALASSFWLLDLHPAQTIARLLPQQTREAMGRNAIASLAGTMRRCETASGRAALERLTQRLVAAASPSPMSVRIVLLDWNLVNAFAAPGGQIIMTRGLVQKAATSDEVAGVLAHELGHTLELHPEASLVRAMGLAAAAQLVFAGSTGTASNLGLLLTQLRYTRVAEREADAHALRILKVAGISAKGFGDFFERIEPKPPSAADQNTQGDDSPKGGLGARIITSELLRTHPLTAERLALVRAQQAYPATAALSDGDWRALREMCGAVAPPPPPPRPVAAAPPPPPRPAPRPPATQPVEKISSPDADREIAEANRALELSPTDVAALQRRASAYTRKGQHADAVVDLAKATQLKPSDPNLQTALGGAHMSLRQYEQAILAFEEALRIDDTLLAARNGRGNANRAIKRYGVALEDFEAIIQLHPNYVFAHYNRGLTHADMGRTEDAVRDFTAALGIDRDYAGALTNRGLLYEKGGEREKAIADFRAALAAPVSKYESGPWAQRTARERLRALGVQAP